MVETSPHWVVVEVIPGSLVFLELVNFLKATELPKAETERLKIPVNKGQAIYNTRTLTYNLSNNQSRKPNHIFGNNCPKIECGQPDSCFWPLLSTQKQPEKVKYATLLLVSSFPASYANSLQSEHTWLPLFLTISFCTLCLFPVQVIVAGSLTTASSELFSFVWSFTLFPSKNKAPKQSSH